MDRFGKHASRAPSSDLFIVHTDCANRRAQQRRVPNRRRLSLANRSFSLPRQAQFCCVSGQAQYRLSFACGRKQRSSVGHRAQLDRRFGTFSSGAALAVRTLTFTRRNDGACADVQTERSRSRGIFQVVFEPCKGFMRTFFGPRRPSLHPPDRPCHVVPE